MSSDGLLTFEVAGSVYALPIADVLEVTELGRLAAVPMLGTGVGGVMNLHGDALPVVDAAALFGVDRAAAKPSHVLVIADARGEQACMGLPVDGVLGLAHGEAVPARPARGAHAQDGDWIAQRRPIGGRVVSIVDTGRLRDRAVESIGDSAGSDAGDLEISETGGET